MTTTSIQWTDKTWNPVTGCDKVSAGCKNCYAETIAKRLWGARKFTDVLCHADRLDQPLRWRRPARVFVNSMSDLFHGDVPFEFVDRVFAVMAEAHRHTFQILTKRPARMLEYLSALNGYGESRVRSEVSGIVRLAPIAWPLPNVWLGVSVENQETADARIPLLLQTPAAVRFVSYEPALGPVDFGNLRGGTFDALTGCGDRERLGEWEDTPRIDWIIVGGESGPGARPFDVQWARNVIAQCKAASVPVFVKQLGKTPYEGPGGDSSILNESRPGLTPIRYYELDIDRSKGGDMAEWPEELRVREFPKEAPRG